jgi:hypothetical protein
MGLVWSVVLEMLVWAADTLDVNCFSAETMELSYSSNKIWTGCDQFLQFWFEYCQNIGPNNSSYTLQNFCIGEALKEATTSYSLFFLIEEVPINYMFHNN